MRFGGWADTVSYTHLDVYKRQVCFCADGMEFCPRFVILTLRFWRCLTISNKELQINDDIRDREVRVIDSDGSQLGIMSANQALDKAAERNLDLVKISPQANPPVCKIMDYGKYRFEQAKREKEARKNQRIVNIKEIRLSLNIDTHDFNTKLGHAKRFIGEGDKVKVSIRFRGQMCIRDSDGRAISGLFGAGQPFGTAFSLLSLR